MLRRISEQRGAERKTSLSSAEREAHHCIGIRMLCGNLVHTQAVVGRVCQQVDLRRRPSVSFISTSEGEVQDMLLDIDVDLRYGRSHLCSQACLVTSLLKAASNQH